jgi:hypothetical protein
VDVLLICKLYYKGYLNSDFGEINLQSQSQSYITTDSQSPVSLRVRHPSGTRDQFFFLLDIFFRQLRVCYFIAHSLTKGRACNLLLLLVLASAVPLWSDSRETEDHILLSQFLRLTQPGGTGPRIPQEQVGPDILLGTGFPFRRLFRLAALRWRYSIPPPHDIKLARVDSKSFIIPYRCYYPPPSLVLF